MASPGPQQGGQSTMVSHGAQMANRMPAPAQHGGLAGPGS